MKRFVPTSRNRLELQKTRNVCAIWSREPGADRGCEYGVSLSGRGEFAEDLWRSVSEGRDLVSELPTDRGWDIEGLYDPEPGKEGKSYVRTGGFVHDAMDFDAGFFGISPREALAMDPQQRLLLEAAWEALERAGIDPSRCAGSDTGVFARHDVHDYGPSMGDGDREASEGYPGHRAARRSVASGRVSYVLGSGGAGGDGRHGVLVVAGGAAPGGAGAAVGGVLAGAGRRRDGHVDAGSRSSSSRRQRGLAPDGRCKSFAAAADGTGWAEGVGAGAGSGCPTPGATGIRCWRWCAVRRSTRTGRPTV